MRKHTVSGCFTSRSMRTCFSERGRPVASARKTNSTSQPAAVAPVRKPRVKSDSVPSWLSRNRTRGGFITGWGELR
jgi:hypothetical protein